MGSVSDPKKGGENLKENKEMSVENEPTSNENELFPCVICGRKYPFEKLIKREAYPFEFGYSNEAIDLYEPEYFLEEESDIGMLGEGYLLVCKDCYVKYKIRKPTTQEHRYCLFCGEDVFGSEKGFVIMSKVYPKLYQRKGTIEKFDLSVMCSDCFDLFISKGLRGFVEHQVFNHISELEKKLIRIKGFQENLNTVKKCEDFLLIKRD